MPNVVLNSVIIQDLTFTEKDLGRGVTISYINGGTAGSEVVTVSGTAITVKIGASTATQIKTAVDANAAASAIVTVTVSGTGSNVQLTCKTATLAGGVAAAKATLTIVGVFKITAHTAGTAGNSIRFKFTSGATAGSEAVTVSTNDISVQIADGVSTFAQVAAAIAASGGAAALIDTASAGPSLGSAASVSMMSAFTSLAGGVAAAAASVIVQDLTIAADATGTAANGVTFSFTTGATAGAEVVTVVGSAINVQIENGVSTATQIETALNGETTFTTPYNVTVSGTGATAQVTVNTVSLTGGVGMGPNRFNVAISTASSGETALVAAITDKRIKVIAYDLVCAAAVSVTFKDGAGGTALTGAMPFAANGGISVAESREGHFKTSRNSALIINLSAAVQVSGHIVCELA
jgi:hypothetical protein